MNVIDVPNKYTSVSGTTGYCCGLVRGRNKAKRKQLSKTNILTKNSNTIYTNERVTSEMFRSDWLDCLQEYCLLSKSSTCCCL